MYVEQFRMLGAEVIDVSAEAQLGLVNVDERLWRFLVADEADLDVFIDRDVHSRYGFGSPEHGIRFAR